MSGSGESMELGYPWSEGEEEAIEKHLCYHREMVTYLEEYKIYGPQREQPQKPSVKLPDFKRKRQVLTGKDLHEYLQTFLGTHTEENLHFPNENINDLNEIQKCLSECVKFEKYLNSRALHFHLECGSMLNKAFELFRIEKWHDTRISSKTTWAKWLKKAGMSEQNAGKKRAIARILGDFPRFKQLGISFNEIYRRKENIQNMLFLNEEYKTFWKTV